MYRDNQDYDVETQLFYCNSRYYSPELCRFISPDSIEYLDPESINGLNLYCYCYNNPIMYVDYGKSITNRNYYREKNSYNDRLNLPELPWLVENATTIYGVVTPLVVGIPILSHYYKYASIINDEFKIYGISTWKTSLQLSNVNFKVSLLEWKLIGFNVVIDMYDSYQRGISTEGILIGGVLTAVSCVALNYLNKGIMWGLTTLGTLICPGIGTAIGFTVGLVMSIYIDLKLGKWISDWIDSITL